MTSIEISPASIQRRSSTGKVADDTTRGALSSHGKRVAISTLGCKVNTFESELIGEALQSDEWQMVPATESADLYLINTCTVTREADRQARQVVRKAIRRNPEALVVVTGCYAQMDPQAVARIPGVDLVLGNDRKLDAHKLLPQLQAGTLPKVLVGDLDQHVSLPEDLVTGFEAHTRAFVQIQQGCDQGCTFCIIHRARGPSRSLAPTLIKRQVQRLVLNGYPEIVICGVDLGAYGEDFNTSEAESAGDGASGYNLVALLSELLKLESDPDNPFRIRLSSIDPWHLTDELIELLASEPRLCPQIHLSMQSGNTLILKRMKRRYTAEFMRQRILALRSRIPELVISADVMVGFPTEEQAQFDDTVAMVKELDIAFPHVFSYSQRDGTPAAKIATDRQVPVEQRKQRNQHIRNIGKQLRQALFQRRLGKTIWVLPEAGNRLAGFTHCRSEDYVPVMVPQGQLQRGKWQRVKITRLAADHVFAEAV